MPPSLFPSLSLILCVAICESLNLAMPQLLPLYRGDMITSEIRNLPGEWVIITECSRHLCHAVSTEMN